MPIRFQCGQCGAGFKAADAQAGQQMPCPKCGGTIQVPLPSAPPAAEVMPEATLAPPDDPLDETESASMGETRVNPFVGIAKKSPESLSQGLPTPPPPPPLAPLSPQKPAEPNAFESPVTPAEEPREVDLTRVKIVNIDLSFWTVLRLTLRFSLAAMLIGFVAWLLIVVFLFLVEIVFGVGIFGVSLG